MEIKKSIIQKKNPQNYYGPLVPNLILSYQTLCITKYGFSWIASKTFPLEIFILAVMELIERVEEHAFF